MKTTVTRVEYEGIYRILITSSADSLTLKSHIDKGIGRFQSWSVRELPAVIDRLESSGGKN